MNHDTLVVYAVAVLALCLNLFGLWIYSAFMRGQTKTTYNKEDAYNGKMSVVTALPEPAARVIRAYDNAEAAMLPFFALGLVFVLLGGSSHHAVIIFSIFVAARYVHSVVYLAGKQPWRSLSFSIGLLATVAVMVEIVCRLLA